ncbi:MAG: tyrosine-type recombinase/integrase [Rhodanobacteraceae bacterium]
MTGLTTRKLDTLRMGRWASDGGARGAGTLTARRLPSGSTLFYYRYTGSNGQRCVVPLGEYGPHALTLDAARDAAGAMAQRIRNGERDLRATLRAEREAAEQQARVAHERTLGALLTAYTNQLERDGRRSAGEVRRVLTRYVAEPFADLWARALDGVTPDDLLRIVAAPVAASKLRQAEMLRAYLRAAYSAGIAARQNAKALPALRELHVTTSPAAGLTPIEGADKARSRALELAELRAYWNRIQAPECAALRFHLLTGCQRVRQLARATLADIDHDAHTLRLVDVKGGRKRRSEPRRYEVPLIPAAMDAMDAGKLGPYIFTFTGGQSGALYAGVLSRVHAVAVAMLAADELPGGLFSPGDLRRTVETRLAAAGVLKETRAHLQSHGLGGVQDEHYDKWTYLPQSRAALETLHRLLTGTSAEVVPLRRDAVAPHRGTA